MQGNLMHTGCCTPDPILTSGNMFEVNQLDDIPFSEVREDSEIYTMPYPYPRYNKGAKAEVHVCIFLTTWQANHVS